VWTSEKAIERAARRDPNLTMKRRPLDSASGSQMSLPAAMPAADRMALSLKLHDRLWDEHAIEVPIIPFGPHMMVRTASHVFNEPSEYLRLVSVLTSLVNDMPLQE
ncbi:MAG: hypothetical protein ACKOAG_03375, partial [Candidatus Kapaibacterium sp.]